jgi:hypothetical protein
MEGKEMGNHPENFDMQSCPFCGEGNKRESHFCVHCGKGLLKNKKFISARRPILLGMIGLLLAGGIILLWRTGSESKLVGKVNGEGVTREEFSKKVDRLKKFYETRYGQSRFQGETGKGDLNRLKTEILDEMITEKFLLQEARKAGFTSAPEEEIEKYVDAIKKQRGLSDADLQKMTGEGIEDLKEELRRGWIISQFIEKAVVKGDQTNGESLFGQWLVKAKASARIETYEKIEPAYTAKASCCKSGCGGGRAQLLDPKMEQEAKAKALEYYERKTQKKGAEAKVTNFGCHIQVDIIEGGKVIVSLTYRQGEVQEI